MVRCGAMLYSLHAPPDNQRGPQYMAQAWAAIHQSMPRGQRLRLGWAQTTDRTTILWCDLPTSLRQDVAHQWLAQYPDCQLRRLPGDPVTPERGESLWVADIRLDPAAYPLQTFAHFEDRLNRQLADPLAAGLSPPWRAAATMTFAVDWNWTFARPITSSSSELIAFSKRCVSRRRDFTPRQCGTPYRGDFLPPGPPVAKWSWLLI